MGGGDGGGENGAKEKGDGAAVAVMVVLGLPLVAVCVLFLALPRRHLLWGFWILWLLALLSMWKLTGGYFLSANVGNMVGTVVSLPLVAGLVALIVATVRRLKK